MCGACVGVGSRRMTIVLKPTNQTAPHTPHNLVRVGGRAWPTGGWISPDDDGDDDDRVGSRKEGERRSFFCLLVFARPEHLALHANPWTTHHPPPPTTHTPACTHHSPLTTGLRIAHHQQQEHPCRSHDHMRRVISSGSGCGCRRLCLLYYIIMAVEG